MTRSTLLDGGTPSRQTGARGRGQVDDVATCIGCGCDDRHACPDGCWWLRVDREAALGVCSCCEDRAEAWDLGDRTPHATPAAELEAIAAGELRFPRPEQPAPAGGCNGDHDWPFEDVSNADTCRHCGMSFIRHVFTECP